ncbi:MAG TPA: FGGY family carbohydrate kinase [Solirubrobacterales bacterium]|nr:FGGY family carbohydrate kinase [Solirubrobacterales bacterium]
MSEGAAAAVLAIDVGTTALKAAVYDERGQLLGEASREYQLATPRPGWVELSCDAYWETLKASLAALWALPAVDPGAIAAIGISAQGETMVPVGAAGEPLRDAIVWLDSRAGEEAAELADRLGGDRFYEVTGQPEMLAAWPAAKVLWLNRHEPEVAEATHRYLLIEDYLTFRLTGEYVTEGSQATSTCYWDFRAKAWWPEMLAAIGIGVEQLPELVEPGAPLGRIDAGAAAELGVSPRAVVCAGALDQACGAIGAANTTAGGFSENTGAAIALCATLDQARLDPRRAMPCHYHGIPDSYMFHTFTSGGIVLRWFRDRFYTEAGELAGEGEEDAYDRLAALAAEVGPGADGLVMLPHLQGAMAPENNDAARGALVGLTLGHGRGHVMRALMESIAFVVRRNVETMSALGVQIDSVRALGGGSRSSLWKQIEADVLGLPVVVMEQSDAGALGAAILAGVGIGWWQDPAEGAAAVVREARVFEPDPANRALYQELYAIYRSCYEALVPSFDQLAKRAV